MSPSSQRRTLLRVAVVLAVCTLAVLAGTRWLAIPWRVLGPSMAPTLEHGDLVVIDLWTYRHRAPRPGEIAVLDGPGELPLVKRVVRGPLPPRERIGDLVDPTRTHEPVFWVEGDGGDLSADSRLFGPVPRSRFRGRVLFRYWPLSGAGPIPSREVPGRETPPLR